MDGSDRTWSGDLAGLRSLYAELLRIEQHWTDQVQNQQQRIATLLTVTGILLGFLAGAGFLTGTLSSSVRPWPAYLYVASLVSLCFGLFMGIRALRPSIPIAGTTLDASSRKKRNPLVTATADAIRSFLPLDRFERSPIPLWLDAQAVWARADAQAESSVLRALCDEAAANQEKARHRDSLLLRRVLMYRQFVFLFLSLALLVAALIGFLVTGGAGPGSP